MRIVTFYRIDKLINHIDNIKSEDRGLFFFDLAKYASKKGYQEHYFQAMAKVADCYIYERKLADKETSVDYSPNLQRILREIGRAIGNNNEEGFIYRFNDISSLILDYTDDTFLSESTYSLLWYMLNNAVVAGNKQWIEDYWTYATQYYRFKSNSVNQGTHNKHIKRFLQFNVMFGALLVQNKQYDVLYHIMTFTQTQPASFPLIPASLGAILEFAVEIDGMLTKFLTIESRYSMIGVKRGIDTDSYIAQKAYNYLSLLVIRLWTYRNYDHYISYLDPVSFPSVDDQSIDKNKQFIRLGKQIKTYIQEWYSLNIRELIPLNNIPEENTIIEKFDEFEKVCKRKINELDQRNDYSEMKLQNIYNEAIRYNAITEVNIPSSAELPNKEDPQLIKKLSEGSETIEKRFLQTGRSDELGNVGNGLSMRLNLHIRQQYMDIVMRAFNVTTYTSTTDRVQEALDGLHLSDDYCIIDVTSGFKYDTNLPIYKLGRLYNTEIIFICKFSDLPSFDIIDEHIDGSNLIDKFNFLYGGIQKDGNNYKVSIKQMFKTEVLNYKTEAYQIEYTETDS